MRLIACTILALALGFPANAEWKGRIQSEVAGAGIAAVAVSNGAIVVRTDAEGRYSLPEREYGAWVYAGGCCQETFAVFYQATGVTTINPKKRRERLPVEPGGGYALPLKTRGQYLKRTHAQHGGQKQPLKWLWIEVPLPKEQTESVLLVIA